MATEVLAWPRPEWWHKFEISPKGCWLWTGTKVKGGYGRTAFREAFALGETLVHRVTYTLFLGPIPEGCQLDHLCRVPSCANPSHLEAVTPLVNMARRDQANWGIAYYR